MSSPVVTSVGSRSDSELPVDGDPNNTKWVMVVNLNPGAVAGGSGGQYFVGEFDGTTFTSESTQGAEDLPAGDVLAGFDNGSFDGWTVSNEPGNHLNGPWGLEPAAGTLPGQNTVTGYVGGGLVNGFYDGDWPIGTLESPAFTVSDDYVNLLVGGGRHPHVAGSQLTNDPPAGTTVFDFELPDGQTLADSGWQITGDFATDPARNPSTNGGEHHLGTKRLNTWEGGPRGDDNVGELLSPRSPSTATSSRSSSAAESAPTAPSRRSSSSTAQSSGRRPALSRGPSTGCPGTCLSSRVSRRRFASVTRRPAGGATSPSTTSWPAMSRPSCAATRRP
nr:hypothetical protein GCM10025699_05940 [Microbacterium flavescens]